MFPFSFVLIARNESKTLPRLLKSIQYFLDNGWEVIIVDTGSTDWTAQIARDLGCKVFEEGDRFRITIDEDYARKINERFIVSDEEPLVKAWDSLFDFASARNYASSLACNDMCWMPDCDEVFTRLDYEAISAMIREWVQAFEYNFVFSHDEHWREMIKFMHSKFYNKIRQSWVWIIHEVLQGEATRKYVWEEVAKLEHYQNEETNRSGYLKGLAIDCYENPSNDRNSHYLWREMLWAGRPFSAICELKRHVEMNRWPAEKAQSLIFIGEAKERLWDTDGALHSYFQAHLVEGNMREPLMKLAEYFFNRQDWSRTITFCEAMLHIEQGNFYASFTDNYTHKPHHLLYVSYWQLWDRDKSTEHFWEAYNYCPLHSKYLHDMRFYSELPRISILVPTLCRPEGLERLKRSIDSLNYPKELIEVIIEEDEPRMGVPKRLNSMYKKSTSEYIVFMANDCEMTPDSLIIWVLEMQWVDLLSFNTGSLYQDRGNENEHFIIRREFIENHLGWKIFDEEMSHVWVDNLLLAQAKKYGVAKRSDNAIIHHHHFSRGANMDDIYSLAYSRTEEDRALLKVKLDLLNNNI